MINSTQKVNQIHNNRIKNRKVRCVKKEGHTDYYCLAPKGTDKLVILVGACTVTFTRCFTLLKRTHIGASPNLNELPMEIADGPVSLLPTEMTTQTLSCALR